MSALTAYDVPRAARALKTLLNDPDDLPQVFVLIDALRGRSLHRLRARLMRHPEGQALLVEQPNVVPLLADREALRQLPVGSVGRAYLAFVESEGITAEGIVAASHQAKEADVKDLAWVRSRLRDTHDLWHVVTGYRGDVLGELSLLGFTLAQNWETGILAIILGALVRGLAGDDPWLIVDGYARGKRAAWLPAIRWESLLDQPLVEVRAQLRVGEPRTYTPLRSTLLREQGLVR